MYVCVCVCMYVYIYIFMEINLDEIHTPPSTVES